MSHSHDEKTDAQDWEDSLDAPMSGAVGRSTSLIGGDNEVIRRFLVTKDKTLMGLGSTTKFLEVLYDGSVRIRDPKSNSHSEPIFQPWKTFVRDVSTVSKKDQNKKSKSSEKATDKLRIFMDGKQKKRYFKFSTLQEKKGFYDLIESLRQNKDKSVQKKKYTTEPFSFAPYEVVGFFIRDATVWRSGSAEKFRDKLVAITNYRVVVIDPTRPNSSPHAHAYAANISNPQNEEEPVEEKLLIDEEPLSANSNSQNQKYNNSNPGYNNPLDQSSSYKQNSLKRGDHIISALTVPHHSVWEYDISDDTMTLQTKDYRTVFIDMSHIENATLRTQSLFMMKRYLLPTDEKDIFAFAGYFSVSRTKTPSHSESDISKLSGFPEIGKVEIKTLTNGGGTSTMNANGHSLTSKSLTSSAQHGLQRVSDEEKMSLFVQLKEDRWHQSHTEELVYKEYRRLGWREGDKSCPFRVTRLNENYDLCNTYPPLLLVPQEAKDNLLKQAAQHRSRNRLPVITWSNSLNITLARSSQPHSGAQNKRNHHDETLLLLLNEMNTYSETFVICDCRPRINAITNKYMFGKGTESGDDYEKAHIIFFDIQNIHRMRESVTAVKKCCENQFDSDWLKNLHETLWFQHITKVLSCSRKVANFIHKDRYSVLVHCSDGWDRTAQVTSVAQLLLDPYYRTFEGFLVLVQKEWLWFGHKMADRNTNYNGQAVVTIGSANSSANQLQHANNDDHGGDDDEEYSTTQTHAMPSPQPNASSSSSASASASSASKKQKKADAKVYKHKKERSPIFLQFLDCVFQVMSQCRWAFEFTHDLLLEFANHFNSGRFGDFFCNCMKERDEQELWLKTPSLFKYLHNLWKLGRFRNPDYIPTKTVLRPRTAVRDMVLWDEVYCRFTIHDKDRHLSTMFAHAHPTMQSLGARGQTHSFSNSKNNRYSAAQSQSPRLASALHPKGGSQPSVAHVPSITNYDSGYDDDDQLNQLKGGAGGRKKPPPPPQRRGGKQAQQLPPSNTTALDQLGDLDAAATPGVNTSPGKLAPIQVLVPDDDDPRGMGDDLVNRFGDSDSDSTSIPEKVKRITMLQQKVARLEAMLKEYRDKELQLPSNPVTPSGSDLPATADLKGSIV